MAGRETKKDLSEVQTGKMFCIPSIFQKLQSRASHLFAVFDSDRGQPIKAPTTLQILQSHAPTLFVYDRERPPKPMAGASPPAQAETLPCGSESVAAVLGGVCWNILMQMYRESTNRDAPLRQWVGSCSAIVDVCWNILMQMYREAFEVLRLLLNLRWPTH